MVYQQKHSEEYTPVWMMQQTQNEKRACITRVCQRTDAILSYVWKTNDAISLRGEGIK